MRESEKANNETNKLTKSYFDVLGICCTSEVDLVEKILKNLEGVKDVSVIVTTKTVIVTHDSLLISQQQIGKIQILSYYYNSIYFNLYDLFFSSVYQENTIF